MRKSLLFFVGLLLFSCNNKTEQYHTEMNQLKVESQIHRKLTQDSLDFYIKKYMKEGNDYGLMIAYKELGKIQRNNTQFSEAIQSHQEELSYAIKLQDTLEIVQALNNLGTNFRRIGALSEASEYHYLALDYIESYSNNDSETGMKSHVVTLNGIGNISLTLGYLEEAKQFFTEALKDEQKLGSHIGQAINYANIGSIFEQRNQLDSARLYYHRSLEQNILGKSDMGIGLCYIHLGDLLKTEKKYDLARMEYQKAYELMEHISDRWHWLVACISIAEINLIKNNEDEFCKYIGLAEETAVEINSPEHLAQIYKLKHDYELRSGNHLLALQNYKLSTLMLDSVAGIAKNNQYLDMRMGHERKKYLRSLEIMEAKSESEQSKKQLILTLLLLSISVGATISALLYYAYRQRTKSNTLLRELETSRTNFFTGITHEFRTPLTVILGMAEKMHETESRVETESIIKQGNIMLNMVNQLLDMAKIRTHRKNLDWVHGDFAAYLSMNVEAFYEYASSLGIDLVMQCDIKILPSDFIPDYTDKIIRNLLSNALKHTAHGGKVVVSLSQAKDTIILTVSDNGKGLLPEEIPYLFDEFFQSRERESTEVGSGLGLAMVKQMIELMQGSIKASNNSEGGAEFIVRLPAKQEFEIAEKWIRSDQKATEKNMHSYFEKSRIINIIEEDTRDIEDENEDENKTSLLIVEDNPDIQQYIGSLFGSNYIIRFASDGKEGCTKANDFMPDLIITDLMMPVMDGFALTRKLRKNNITSHIPVIVISAKTSGEDKQKALKAGANAYLTKPFNASELKIRVVKLLEHQQMMREKFSSIHINEDDDDTINISQLDHKFLNQIISLVHENMEDKDMSVDFIADKVFMSRSQLNRKIKQITGYSTSAYLLHIRLEKAKRLLKSSNTPIGDIATMCGFDDSSYFSRIFRQVYHTPPSQFRKDATSK